MTFDATDFHAALVHELKNQLALLSITLESIPLQGEAAHDAALDAAQGQCRELVGRLQQALLLYKADKGPLQPAVDAHSPHELLEAIRGRAQALARGRLRVEVEAAAEVPAVWFFDRALVEMALLNAVHNSLVHARNVIRLGASLEGGRLALSVRDDSPGYPAQVLDSGGAEAPHRGQGSGLGLQFSRLIAQAHRNGERAGELRLRNDQGAVFGLLLP
jgi:signal transduction histidine kinase